MKIERTKIEEAKKEIEAKSLDDIQRETAIKWAYRSIAATELSQGDDEYGLMISEFEHEAREHASLCDDLDFLKEVVELMQLDAEEE